MRQEGMGRLHRLWLTSLGLLATGCAGVHDRHCPEHQKEAHVPAVVLRVAMEDGSGLRIAVAGRKPCGQGRLKEEMEALRRNMRSAEGTGDDGRAVQLEVEGNVPFERVIGVAEAIWAAGLEWSFRDIDLDVEVVRDPFEAGQAESLDLAKPLASEFAREVEPDPDGLVGVNVDRDGRYEMLRGGGVMKADERLSWAELQIMLKLRMDEPRPGGLECRDTDMWATRVLVLRVDRRAPFRAVRDLLETCRYEGLQIEHIYLAVGTR
ncbi:MAG: hypothetical protein HY812_00645 [Planctomycetes bacterium]|nr:hypothetical protein [Planctomycetota bacterium]